jgi:C-terminal processing protease CtpA/Prc
MVRRAVWVLVFVLATLPAKLFASQQSGSSAPAPSDAMTHAPTDAAVPAPSATPAPANTTPGITTSPAGTTSTANKPATAVHGPIVPGSISKSNRERVLGILDTVVKGIQENYYDPKTNGVDWDAVLANARIKIAESNSLNAALAQVAAAVGVLNDSHTVFEPPYRPYKLDWGFEYQMIWSRCFVTRVRPGSDAAAKGVKPGAEVLSIDGVVPKRQNLWGLDYLVHTLDPQPEMAVELQYPSGEKQSLRVTPNVTQASALTARFGGGVWNDMERRNDNDRHRLRMQVDQFGDVAILKFPEFVYDSEDYHTLSGKIKNDKTLIIDLRGDPGGYVVSLEYFLGMFFDKDLKVADRVERNKTKPEIVKSEHHMYFPGKVIVLVDSKSSSAAEIFARVMQLEKRGTVMGDLSSGYVMEAKYVPFFSSGVDYGAEITEANLIMTDGKSIEHRGVKPDEPMFPDPSDIEAGRDPVLAHAAQEVGVNLTPEAAGKLFPYEWPKD